MGATVGELLVRLTGSTDGLDRAFARGEQGARTFAGNVDRSFSRAAAGVITLNQAVQLTAFAIHGTQRAFEAAVGPAIAYESAFAGVRKTVNASEAEFTKLDRVILGMTRRLPVSATEIAKIFEIGGQLGIATPALQKFADTVIRIGVSTNLTSQEAATAFARLANIVQLPQDQLDRLGSTIVALGNNLATTEKEISEMGLRIAGAG